jgi:hypothetical protein
MLAPTELQAHPGIIESFTNEQIRRIMHLLQDETTDPAEFVASFMLALRSLHGKMESLSHPLISTRRTAFQGEETTSIHIEGTLCGITARACLGHNPVLFIPQRHIPYFYGLLERTDLTRDQSISYRLTPFIAPPPDEQWRLEIEHISPVLLSRRSLAASLTIYQGNPEKINRASIHIDHWRMLRDFLALFDL